MFIWIFLWILFTQHLVQSFMERFAIAHSLLQFQNGMSELKSALKWDRKNYLSTNSRDGHELYVMFSNSSMFDDNNQPKEWGKISSTKHQDVLSLFPQEFHTLVPGSVISRIVDDMVLLTDAMHNACCDDDKISVKLRLSLLQGTRCPKWHEDHVWMRLVTTYLGPGSEWVDPGDFDVRLENFFRRCLSMQMRVSDDKVLTLCPGDVLVMSGRQRHGHVPVLHRSPVGSSDDRRLLFTITLSKAT